MFVQLLTPTIYVFIFYLWNNLSTFWLLRLCLNTPYKVSLFLILWMYASISCTLFHVSLAFIQEKKNTTMHGSYTFLMYSKYLLLIFLRIPKSSNVYWEAHKKLKRCTNMDTMDKTRLSKQYKFLNFATNQLYWSPQINWAWSQVSCSILAMQGCMLGILDSAVTSPPCISS